MKFLLLTRIKKGLFFLLIICATNCVKDGDFKVPKEACDQGIKANMSLAEVKLLFKESTVQIQEDIIIEGYIISSDRAGNFFGTLHFQDSPVLPTEGMQLEIDLRDSHLFFELGTKIMIRLKGLYLGKSNSVYKLGGIFTAFGNGSVGRLPASLVEEHIFLSCDEVSPVKATEVSIKELTDQMLNNLIEIDHLEVDNEQLNLTYANQDEATERLLVDCEGRELILLNSGYSNFYEEKLPRGNGKITGILSKASKKYQLQIRDTSDLAFKNERCSDIMNEISTDKIFISELADPDNNNKARFVELYNADTMAVVLDGWVLNRYTNANTEIGSTTDLTGYSIAGKSTLVISPNKEEFKIVYGFEPDVAVGGNSPADSNGDDNLELVDPFGNVIDSFGIIGEDGTGTNHEFEDGRALRILEIANANHVFNFSEWNIYNDTGAMGTENLPQNAPEDFTPGIR